MGLSWARESSLLALGASCNKIMCTLGGDQESVGPQSPLLQRSLLSGPELHSCTFVFGMILTGLRMSSFRSEVGGDFLATRVPYRTKYLLLTHAMVDSRNVYGLLSQHFFTDLQDPL